MLLVIAGGFLAVFSPAARARLDLTDDHEILRFASPRPVHPDLTDHFEPVDSVWDIAFTRDIAQGRFRPVYYLFRFGEIALMKTSSAAWHSTHLGLGILTCFFLYVAGRRLRLSRLAAALLAAWVTLQAGATEIWVRLGPSETQAMLFFSVALLAIAVAPGRRTSRRWDAVALASMALMGWSKETFVLVIPALLLTRLALEWRLHPGGWRQAWRAAAFPLGAGTVLFTGQLAVVLWLYLRGGYGSGVLRAVRHPFSPAAWATILGETSGRFSYFVPVGFAVLLFFYDLARRKGPSRRGLVIVFLLAAAALPQLPLLVPEWTGTRYMYPLIVALAAANALALEAVARRGRLLLAACLIPCLVLLVPAAIKTRVYATNFTNRTVALNRMLDEVADMVTPEEKIVLFVHPVNNFEASISLLLHLGSRGVTSPVYVHPAGNYRGQEATAIGMMQGQFPRRVDTADLAPSFVDRLRSAANPRPGEALNGDDVGAIIVLTTGRTWTASPPRWYDPAAYRAVEFTAPRWFADGFRRKPSGSYRYLVMEKRRGDTGENPPP